MLTVHSDEHFMKQALREAQTAFSKDEVPVGAVITANNRIIARAHNLTETLTDVTAHAEMQAFTAASEALGGKYLKDCTLYVTLEPCVMCAGASYWSQIGRIVIGADDPTRGYTSHGSLLHPTTQVSRGIMSNECSDLIKSFFKQKRI